MRVCVCLFMCWCKRAHEFVCLCMHARVRVRVYECVWISALASVRAHTRAHVVVCVCVHSCL